MIDLVLCGFLAEFEGSNDRGGAIRCSDHDARNTRWPSLMAVCNHFPGENWNVISSLRVGTLCCDSDIEFGEYQ